MDGTIKKIFLDDGYGFISTPTEKRDIFFHITDLADRAKFPELQTGQAVTYDAADNAKGPRALNVRLVG